MDFIISFFRDFLDGPIYIVFTIICSILICSCIGYLAEMSINKKKQKQQYDNMHSTVSNEISNNVVSAVPQIDSVQFAQNVVDSNTAIEASQEVLVPNVVAEQQSVTIPPVGQNVMPVPEVSQVVPSADGVKEV